MPFSDKAFKGLVSHTHKEIASAKYKIGNTYYEATINSIEEKKSELILHLQFNPPLTSDVTVTEIALYDTSGDVFYKKAENIKFSPLNEGVIVRITINFMEVS